MGHVHRPPHVLNPMLSLACISGLGDMQCGMGHSTPPGTFHTLVNAQSERAFAVFML